MAKVKGKALDTTTKDMVNWNAELAAAAEAANKVADQVDGGGARRIVIKGGQMMIDDNPVPGNALVGVVAAFTLHNKYFAGEKYDPENPTSPVCYAYGDGADEMGPHDEAEQPQAERCQDCEHNKFGSADQGKGKACKNTFQLMVLPVGDYDHKQDSFDPPANEGAIEEAEAHALSVPPTSLKAFKAYAAKVASRLRPPWAVYTRIGVTPDPKTQWKLGFVDVGDVESGLLRVMKERHEEAAKALVVAYQKNSEREAPKKAPGKGARPRRY